MKRLFAFTLALAALAACIDTMTVRRNADGTMEYVGSADPEEVRFLRDGEACASMLEKMFADSRQRAAAECVSTPDGYRIKFDNREYLFDDYYLYDAASGYRYSRGDLVGPSTYDWRRQYDTYNYGR